MPFFQHFVDIKMRDDSEIIFQTHCFYVSKLSYPATIRLYPNFLTINTTGIDKNIIQPVYYSEINEVIVENMFGHAVGNLEIQTNKKRYLLSGFHGAEKFKLMINFLKINEENPMKHYGFVKPVDDVVKYNELKNPKVLYSNFIESNFQTVIQHFRKKETIEEFYQKCGNKEITISDWKVCSDYEERVIDFLKLVKIPIVGNTLIKVRETQRQFNFVNKTIIVIVSELGDTPYADSFDPLQQIVFINQGSNVEYKVLFEMLWKKQPSFKSIILTSTENGIKETTIQLYKTIVHGLGGNADDTTENNTEITQDNFNSTKRIYKISIIILTLILFGCMLIKHSPPHSLHFGYHQVFSVTSVILFFVYLFYFQ